jgi:hypothetical protein
MVVRLNRSEERMHRAQQDFPDFNQILNRISAEEVHKTVCPGGWFAVVVLNDRPEMKPLAPFSVPPDADSNMLPDAVEERLLDYAQESIRNATKYIRSQGLGKRDAARLVAEAAARIERAYNNADCHYMEPCGVHCPSVTVA